MSIASQERSLLLFVTLHGAICTLSGFIGYFLMRQRGYQAKFEFTCSRKQQPAPFKGASDHVVNRRALDIAGDLGDRIVVREVTL